METQPRPEEDVNFTAPETGGAPTGPELAPEDEPFEPEWTRQPQRNTRHWYNPFSWRNREQFSYEDPERLSIDEEDRRLSEQESGQLTRNAFERLEALKDDPEGLVHFLSLMNAQEFQQLRIREKHGEKISKLKQIVSGELNFELTKDGDYRKNAFNELVYHGAKVFDKQTAVGAAFYGVVGLLTGFGIPGLAALGGRIVGRAGVEIASSGEDRRQREIIARETLDDWEYLTNKAQEYIYIKEGMNPAERANALTEIIETFYNKSTQMTLAEAHLAESQAVWDKRREKAGKIGSWVGGAAGLFTGIVGLTNMVEAANLDGDKVSHDVRLVDGIWQYAANAGERIGNHFDFVGRQWHALGDMAQIGKMFGVVALGLAGVFGGFKLGSLMEKSSRADEERRQRQAAERFATQHDQMAAGVAEIGEMQAGPDGNLMTPEEVERAAREQERQPAVPEKYAQLVEQKGMPEAGEVWLARVKNPDNNQTVAVAYKVGNINWDEGLVRVNQVDNMNHSNNLSPEFDMQIDQFLNQFDKEGKMIDYWMNFARSKDTVRLKNGELVVDQLDMNREKRLESNKDYRLELIPDNRKQVQLVDSEGKKSVVNIIDLLIGGPELIESQKSKEAEVDLEVNHRYGLPEGADLPNVLHGIPDKVILRKGKNGYFVDGPNGRPLILTKEQLKLFAETYVDMGPAGNQKGGGPQRQGGGPQNQA